MLLVDETYRDLTHGTPLPMAATLSTARDQRLVDVEGVRAAGLAGRLGGVPRSGSWFETLLAAKEQMFICGATLDEAIAGRVLADRERVLAPILADVRDRLAIVRAWMRAQDTFEWVEPTGGVVGLVRFAPRMPVDTDRFYDCCSRVTAPTWARGTGSKWTIPTFASASVGRARGSCGPGSRR